jgi:tetratricopeptide (TPR) repeat protein
MLLIDPEGSVDDLMNLAQEAIPVFEHADDQVGLMHAWWAIAMAEHSYCRFAARHRALEGARGHALLAGDERMAGLMTMMMGSGYSYGPFPVEEGLRWFDAQESLASSMPILLSQRAELVAFQGRYTEARDLLLAAEARMRELGQQIMMGSSGESWWYVEMHGGDPETAERALRAACELLDQAGEKGWLSTQAAELGHTLCDLGRYDEAEEWARRSRELGAGDDVITQMLWRQVMARVLARRGSVVGAERLAREAVALGAETDMLVSLGLAHLDLAEVLEEAGRPADAAAELESALGLLERKGDVPLADRARSRLERLL